MHQINVLIAEDDVKQQQLINNYLERMGNVVVKGIASNSEELMDMAIEWNSELDALILDVELGSGRTGLDTYARLPFRGVNIPAILVTGSKPEGSDTYDLGIIDVVEKPYTSERLIKAVGRLAYHVEYERFVLNGGIMVPVHDSTTIKQIYLSDVLSIAFNSVKKHSIVMTSNGVYHSQIPVKVYESYLQPHGFYRTTRSSLVNIKKIKNIENLEIELVGQSETLPVTEDRVGDIVAAWNREKRGSVMGVM